jgi:hypothetical protein
MIRFNMKTPPDGTDGRTMLLLTVDDDPMTTPSDNRVVRRDPVTKHNSWTDGARTASPAPRADAPRSPGTDRLKDAAGRPLAFRNGID